MSLKVRYDLISDRMRLLVQAPEATPYAFWVTRPQWMVLMRRLQTLSQHHPKWTEPQALTPPRRPRKDQQPETVEAVPLDDFRVRPEGDGFQLLLVTGQKALAIPFRAAGLQRLLDMLAQQAERAGWDPQAALERLQAYALARAAMDRASKPEAPKQG